MSTTEQQLREQLTGSPFGDLNIQHEGSAVKRWITGGDIPDLYVTFHHKNGEIEVVCFECHAVLGSFPENFDEAADMLLQNRINHHH